MGWSQVRSEETAPIWRRVAVNLPAPLGETMRVDAQQAKVVMGEELGRCLGRPTIVRAAQVLHQEFCQARGASNVWHWFQKSHDARRQ